MERYKKSQNINDESRRAESGVTLPTVHDTFKPIKAYDVRQLEVLATSLYKSPIEDLEDPDFISEDNSIIAQARKVIEDKLIQFGHDWRAA